MARAALSWPTAMGASLLAALGRPSWWLLAMAAFLIRGGLLVLVLPIVSLPTAAGVSNVVAPTVVGIVFGGTESLTALVLGAGLAILVWLIGGSIVAAAIDVALVEEVALDDDLDAPVEPRPGLALRAAALRLLAHLPTLLVLVWAGARLAIATYEELAAPGEAAVPMIVRIALRAPEAVAALTIAWALGEAAGGLAVRRLVAGRDLRAALRDGWLTLARPTTLATLVVGNAATIAIVLLSGGVAAVTWNALRLVIVDGGVRTELLAALFIFSIAWLAGAWLIAITVAWRQAAWTFEALRARRI